ncbi:T-cell ecto-ADP-ribosyltransferase 1-like [Protopterus annectens]|uniref:T-cell ecto-ADP-ribosyltransferase 1-like n=1 Tax=Protopterus annectens TaxID=7888 RepID=UPI001CF9C830|nr:T-cell ecto-ADP-ribosyltransferase 1-like [Protopterus annectens]
MAGIREGACFQAQWWGIQESRAMFGLLVKKHDDRLLQGGYQGSESKAEAWDRLTHELTSVTGIPHTAAEEIARNIEVDAGHLARLCRECDCQQTCSLGTVKEVTGCKLLVVSQYQKAYGIDVDYANYAYDDQYINCAHDFERKRIKPLFKNEIKKKNNYNAVWNKAAGEWKKKQSHITNLPHNFKNEYGIALTAYTMEGNSIYSDLNKAVREAGKNLNSFHFKYLHFYLTKALQSLRNKSNNKCFTVFRGVSYKFGSVNKNVRFGNFASSSLKRDVAKNFSKGNGLFHIQTCHGVRIAKFSVFPSEEEVLIPPYEVFRSTKKSNSFMYLKSLGICSNYNCGIKQGNLN